MTSSMSQGVGSYICSLGLLGELTELCPYLRFLSSCRIDATGVSETDFWLPAVQKSSGRQCSQVTPSQVKWQWQVLEQVSKAASGVWAEQKSQCRSVL